MVIVDVCGSQISECFKGQRFVLFVHLLFSNILAQLLVHVLYQGSKGRGVHDLCGFQLAAQLHLHSFFFSVLDEGKESRELHQIHGTTVVGIVCGEDFL